MDRRDGHIRNCQGRPNGVYCTAQPAVVKTVNDCKNHNPMGPRSDSSPTRSRSIVADEEDFHDAWAHKEDPLHIDIRKANETCTAPELRFIHRRLGNLAGRKILDVGCGRGETSVYFALKGAQVTALDISAGMLELTSALAKHHGTQVHLHQADAHCLGLDPEERFDVIHAANVLHHVDIPRALPEMIAHLAPAGTFISWDPLAYNPAINVYRKMATAVRTEDEHPLRRADVRYVASQFGRVEMRWFWLSTLIIFMLMATWQRRNPNRERYWKAVVDEGDQWAWLYRPLARADELLLNVMPPLRWWCWNVLIVGQEPIRPPSIMPRASSSHPSCSQAPNL